MADGLGAVPPPDPHATARDWITIWQSELAALAADRELQDSWVRMVAVWAQAAETALRFMPGGDPAPGYAGPAAAAGPAPVMAAPDARDAAIARLAARIDALERQLAGLTGTGHAPPA